MADLPKAPQHEGVDPLTKGKKYQDGENLKENSTLNDEPTQAEIEATERSEQTLADQEARNAEANTVIDEAGEVDLADLKKVEVPENDEHVQIESTPAGDVATEPTQYELETAEIAENGTVGEGDSEVADTAEAEQPTE